MEPDFSKYSFEELNEIEESLDKEKYPERYERLIAAITSHPSSQVNIKVEQSDEALRALFKEYKNEKFQFWKLFRGVFVMFIAFRIMKYFEWSTFHQIIGAVVVIIIYMAILITINERQFSEFKSSFGKRT